MLSTAALGAVIAIALVGVVQIVIANSTSDAVRRVLEDRTEAVVSSADAASTPQRLVVPDAQLDPGVAIFDATGELVGGNVAPSQADCFAELGTSRTERSPPSCTTPSSWRRQS